MVGREPEEIGFVEVFSEGIVSFVKYYRKFKYCCIIFIGYIVAIG